MEAGDGDVEVLGGEVVEQGDEASEGTAGEFQILGRARCLQGDGVLDKVVAAPVLSVLVDEPVGAPGGRNDGQRLAAGITAVCTGLLTKPGGDGDDVLHQALRLVEDMLVDALQDVAAQRTVSEAAADEHGIVDVAFAVIGCHIMELTLKSKAQGYGTALCNSSFGHVSVSSGAWAQHSRAGSRRRDPVEPWLSPWNSSAVSRR